MRNEDQFVDEYGSGSAGAQCAYPGHYGSVKSLKLKCVSADESVLALVHCSAGSDQRMQINVPYGLESAKLVANHNFSHRHFKYISIDETG